MLDLDPPLEPAATVIEICGGIKAVAEMTGRTENGVRRWTYPRAGRRGTGGLIPTSAQADLMKAARERGIDLRPEHLFVGATKR